MPKRVFKTLHYRKYEIETKRKDQQKTFSGKSYRKTSKKNTDTSHVS